MSGSSPEPVQKYCQMCGNPIWDCSNFCAQCGASPKAGKAFCYECGAETISDASFCGKCGAALTQAVASDFQDVQDFQGGDFGLWDGFIRCFKKYATFSGRARRKEYWGFLLFTGIFSFFLSWVPMLDILWSLATILPCYAVSCRRFHDRGYSGYVLLCLILLPVGCAVVGGFLGGIMRSSGFMILGIVVTLIFVAITFVITCLDSQPGANRYGPNPKGQ